HVPPQGFAVVNTNDAEAASRRNLCEGATGRPRRPENVPRLRVSGEHNRTNAACAARMAQSMGINDETVARALAEFGGLPHRLTVVADISRRRFYNDSKSTTPQATMAALSAVEEPIWLLLGGAMRPADMSELVQQTIRKAKGVAIFGEAAPALATAFR